MDVHARQLSRLRDEPLGAAEAIKSVMLYQLACLGPQS